MSAQGQLRVLLVILLVAALVAGLVRRRRSDDCYSFLAYLLAVGLASMLMLAWPETFWTPHFYLAKESLLGLLKLAVAVELAYRVFGLFPGAMARARALLWPLSVFAVISIGRLATWDHYGLAVTTRGAELQGWTIWLLAVTLVLALHYNLPVLYFHRAILFGFVGYLAVSATLLNLLRKFGVDQAGGLESVRLLVSSLNGWSYVVLLAVWTHAAWRSEPDLSAETLSLIRARA